MKHSENLMEPFSTALVEIIFRISRKLVEIRMEDRVSRIDQHGGQQSFRLMGK